MSFFSLSFIKYELDPMADSGVKDMLMKQIEQEKMDRAEKVAIAIQITDSMNI